MVLNHRWTRPALFALAATTALTVIAPAAAYADSGHADTGTADSSQAAPVTGGIPLVDTAEKIGPGINLQHVKALDQKGWYDAQYLTVNLANSAVSTNLLTSGPVASGGPLSAVANKAGAVAGVNGEFFDIGNSNAALGGEVQDGKLLKSADIGGRDHVGVSNDGIAQLVDLTVNASANFAGADHKVLSINAADGSGVPADGMIAYTSAWGTYSRNRALTGVSNDQIAEVLVENGKVVSVTPTGPAGSGAIPDDGFVLVGRGAAATAIRALQPGDPVALSYALADNVAKTMKFALGDGGTIVSGGKVVNGLDTSIAPRTALGFKDDGHTLVLATWDGPGGTGKGGVGIDKEARDLAAMGVQTAVNLDGGGSTTMVARALGEDAATVRNVPSDGGERSDPNGVGVFVAKGDGKLHQLLVKPAAGAAAADGGVKVFPGMHRALVAEGTDSNQTPVTVDPKSVRWNGHGASVTDGTLAAPAKAHGTITIDAHVGGKKARQQVTVLDPVSSVELSSERLSIADATPDDAVTLSVTGRDDQGYTAPIDPRDLSLDYDHSVVDIQPVDGKLKITPLTDAGTILTVSAGGKSVQLPITVGVQTKTVYDFDDDVLARWHNNSTAATTFSKDPDGLRIDFNAMRNVGITAASAAQRIQVPGQPLRLRVRIKSSISVPSGLTYLGYYDGNGKANGIYGTGLTASSNYQYATFTLPANTAFPISISSFQGINTSVAQQKAGTFVLDRVEADVPTTIDLPAQPDLQPDPLVSDDGSLLQGSGTWKFATLSDVQFTADNPALSQVATAAIERIRKTKPDLLVLNGDITDRGLPQDLALARKVLTDAGCDLIPVGQEPAEYSTPDPKAGSIPCYYVPGNHESYGLNNVQQDLTNFTSEFGQPYRTFDHKGTRFILLASSLGTLHGTAWDQLPMMQKALADAEKDPTVKNVMVFAHHPVDDPAETKSSQLGDRDEVSLIEKMLTDFRDTTGKGAAMVGSHAQIANVHRVEGVPYTVLPSSGKDPYGTPDRGGFTGWVDWSVDTQRNADQQWLEADVRAFAQSITLDTPDSVEAGKTAQLSGSIIQPEGVSTGTRVVPLRYPMSVEWGGSSNLAIGSGKAAVDKARDEGKVAILDPQTRTLTALRRGSVTVSVTNDSMRAYTDDTSLAPITTSKTIQVVPSTSK
ncbi:phosphodiester glycosidase family protein [Actinacidiphila acididurans]|uniref:Phosphodiester glycosidase family protein n=1 Tax=Actinacidiphila acididurans TaxID=2784346 RepID=A0ABS2TS88_9ACTN|nr:phosphodiester glycosidase family protein [Actinacidiphila acididurans]MBM9506204.1 phosphodiester glycosidase family protein [Actinacidiphila acididurans]